MNFRSLTTLVILNCANMYRFSFRHSHFKTHFYSTKKNNNIELKSLSNFYKPKTSNQELYVKYLNDPATKLLFAVGPAGTGKTMLACNYAIMELKSGNIKKIIITRPVVPVEEEELGFLPGNINKKMDPWIRPIFDIFYDFYNKKDIENMLNNNIIEISPLAFMRGRTFKYSCIIADEMQNSSPNQMLMLTTRIGSESKMIITGDLKQSDRGINSGLSDFIYKYKIYNDYLLRNGNETNNSIKIVELNNSDIERSKLISKLLDIYDFNITNITNIPKNNSESESTSNENEKSKLNQTILDNKKILRANRPTGNDDSALIPLSHMSPRVRE